MTSRLTPASGEFRNHLFGECAQRVPVVRPLAERDREARAPEIAELRDHVHRLLRRPAQPPRAPAAIAPVGAEGLLPTRHALGVGAEIEAEVDRAEDRLRVTSFPLAPLGEHLALPLPLRGADVRAVPAVGVLRGGAERALLAAPADPDRDAGLQR